MEGDEERETSMEGGRRKERKEGKHLWKGEEGRKTSVKKDEGRETFEEG